MILSVLFISQKISNKNWFICKVREVLKQFVPFMAGVKDVQDKKNASSLQIYKSLRLLLPDFTMEL